MGNSVSCFDPVREHPPYSWPKDHPGRDAAIAEKRRQRREQKIVGTQGSSRTVSKEVAKEVQFDESEKHPPGHRADIVEKESMDRKATEEATIVRSTGEDIINGGEEHANSSSMQETIAIPESIVDRGSTADSEHSKLENGGNVTRQNEDTRSADITDGLVNGCDMYTAETVEDAVECSVPVAAMEESTGGISYTAGEKKGPGLEEETGDEGVLDSDDEESTSVQSNAGEAKEEYVEEFGQENFLDEQAAQEEYAMQDRIAVFEQEGDELPQPKEISRDVHDPVTGEFISLAEYRRRQMDRAEGLVKERVEQYEDVVDERAKEKAEQAAIEAVRSEAIEKHQWTFKTSETKIQPSPEAGDVNKKNAEVEVEVLNAVDGACIVPGSELY